MNKQSAIKGSQSKSAPLRTTAINQQETIAASPLDIPVMRDWQVTAILPNNMLVETDCNSGTKRTLKKSSCSCGQPVLIEYDSTPCRTDGKRIFYPDSDDTGRCAFRCKQCKEPVHITVPGAEWGPA